ncbi:flagellar hook protein FlgE [Kushneria avicenniae]|uniref:Flagellar hook protein FlgE n=1 Tax=Kushneria avicenniae TaxID=402385 RepID=A0A1I1F840_9GAMM|nr:flagellar hook protein FlgE [Kushneria avicenniae]SFB95555.1 flagellar hook protein FlgE [Kushneria avicenniae]
MAFTQGVSGLNAASSQLDTIGHNIANSQTVGFKKSRTEFADLYAGAKAGLGVQVSGITQGFSQGALETTDRNLDLAIDGGGFFRLTDGQQTTYSRNGQFQMDANGFLVNNTGGRLTGYPVDDPASANPVVLAGAQPVALQVAQGDLDASATTSGNMTFNLDSTDTARVNANGDAIAFDADNPKSYNWQTSLTTYDSQGNAQQVNMYFVKSATDSNSWTVHALNKGNEVGTSNLAFNENGKITGGDTLNLAINPGNGAAQINANIDLSSVTQNSGSFVVKAAGQNGYAAGSLTGISIADNGDVLGNYSNNQSRALGRVALASFTNEQGLRPDGNNAWVATTNSGQELLGSAGTGQLGSLLSGTLENSNVDLASELVTMIVAQRNYQANSQTIKTQDQILQTMVSLR